MSLAANTVPPGAEVEGNIGSGTPRPNPVALEVVVHVTGAKPSGGSGARELFSEETTTVLVFKDGAVIRLMAPVSAGQLLFLTNKRSNQEVVCQVLRTKSFPQASSYVELQFTEERANYWGVAFPEEKKGTAEFRAEEQVQAEKITAEQPETPVPPHRAEDVDQLKREVEALRGQLAALEKKNVEEAAAKAMAEATAAREAAAREVALRDAAKAMETITGGAPKATEEVAAVKPASPTVAAKVEEEKPALLMPAAKDKHEAPRPVVKMSLPVWKTEKSPEEQLLEEEAAAERKIGEGAGKEASEELLPKPELDFTKLPKKRRGRRAPNFKARKAGLVLVLVLVTAGGTWYGQWWKYLPLGKKASAATGNVVRPNLPRSAPAGNAKAVSPTANAGTIVGAGANAPATNAAAVSAVVANGAVGKDSGKDETSGSDAGSVEVVAEKPVETRTAVAEKKVAAREKSVGHRETAAAAKTEEQTSDVAAVASDAPMQPAKLLKTVNPVYPPDAMLNYITGDVKAEVVVEASGHVGGVKVISGPKALREAAVEALKQYEYAPATQGGKAVESKAEVVVKFWFNP